TARGGGATAGPGLAAVAREPGCRLIFDQRRPAGGAVAALAADACALFSGIFAYIALWTHRCAACYSPYWGAGRAALVQHALGSGAARLAQPEPAHRAADPAFSRQHQSGCAGRANLSALSASAGRDLNAGALGRQP